MRPNAAMTAIEIAEWLRQLASEAEDGRPPDAFMILHCSFDGPPDPDNLETSALCSGDPELLYHLSRLGVEIADSAEEDEDEDGEGPVCH